MTKRFSISLLAAGLLLALAAGQPAYADAIDGHWCHRDGRRLSIAGPQIVTPGRHRITGSYFRHAFSYTVPANEPGAGTTIKMTLIDENTVHLRVGGDPETQVWYRCRQGTS